MVKTGYVKNIISPAVQALYERLKVGSTDVNIKTGRLSATLGAFCRNYAERHERVIDVLAAEIVSTLSEYAPAGPVVDNKDIETYVKLRFGVKPQDHLENVGRDETAQKIFEELVRVGGDK
jgi:hypothetical protein